MHRSSRRLRARKTLALFTGGLLAAATLTLGSSPAATADAPQAAAAQDAAEDFQQVTLAKGAAETGEPMSLAVLPDRSVLHTSRSGELRITDSSGNTRVSGTIPVYSHDEEGLQGVGIDPDFAENRAIYLYYAPPLDTPALRRPGERHRSRLREVRRSEPPLPLRAQGGRDPRQRQREEGPGHPCHARHVLPRRRRHRLRRAGQPLPLDG